MAATETPTYIGSPVPRREDKKLLTGQGSYVDNLTLPGMLWMALVRSPYAHARIVGVDVAAAASAPGVVAAYSGHDLAEEWGGPLPCAWPVTEDIEMPPHWPLAQDKARYEGDAVAVVVAESRAEALDAAELIQVEWEQLPAVTDVAHALDAGAPLVHDNLPSNKCYVWPLEGGDVAKAFADAEVTVSERYRQQRLIPSAIEPRGVLAQSVQATGELTLWSATQVPHILRVTLSGVLGMPEAKLRVIAPDVGGGFGSKLNVYAEEALALLLARRLGRPIKWIEERTEGFHATIHGRDVIQEIELAATKEGRITGVRVRLTAAMGAYLQLVTPGVPLLGAWIYNGAYDIPAYGFECTGVFTHTTPTDAYRGAGRPEATYAIERTVDALARAVGKDPVEVRRLNFIKEFPHTIASGLTIDSGDYDRTLDRVLELAGYDDAARRAGEAAGERRSEAARDRPLDLQRDVRARTLADPRRDPLRRGRLGRGHDPLPADRDGAGADRHLAARPGPRDRVLADRRGPARLHARRGGGASRRYGGRPARDGHLRQPQPRRRRGRALPGRRQDPREGQEDRRAPDRGLRGRSRVHERPLPGQGLRSGHVREGGRVPCLDGAQPSRRARARASRRPPSTTRRTSAGPAARTSPSSRSTPRRAIRA